MISGGGAPYVLGGVLSSAYAVWGSLLPFDFQCVPLSTAIARMLSEWEPNLLRWSTTDVIANVALFFPIGMTWAAALDHTLVRRWSALLVVALAAGLSLTLEVGQAFVSWRTPSLLDVLLECTGAVIGVAVWRRHQHAIDRRVRHLVARWRCASRSEQALVLYAAAFAGAWLFPYDFTLRPHEIYDKYAHHRLILPFQPSPDAATPALRSLATAAAIPFGMAAVAITGAGAGQTSRRAYAVASFGLVLLTLAQALVFSRTTDGTLLAVALPGAAAGVCVATLSRRWSR